MQATTKPKAKVTKIHRYLLSYPNGEHHTIDFIPVDNMPGFSHRVAYDGKLVKKWLWDQRRPDARSAQEMVEIIQEEAA
jgi:hypothetical protein